MPFTCPDPAMCAPLTGETSSTLAGQLPYSKLLVFLVEKSGVLFGKLTDPGAAELPIRIRPLWV